MSPSRPKPVATGQAGRTPTAPHQRRPRLTAARRLGLLARAGALVGTSFDDEATLRGLADLLLPAVADFCVIDLVEPEGAVRRVIARNVDPALAEVMTEALADPPRRDGAGDIAAALRDGEPRLLEPTLGGLSWARQDPARAARFRRLGLRSTMVVPLVARDRVLAVVTVGSVDVERRFVPDDLAFIVELARRAAAAIDNARLYRELERFKAAVDATTDGVLMIDPSSLRVIYVNRGVVRSLGYGEKALLRMRLTDLVPSQDRGRVRDLVSSLRQGGQPSALVTAYVRRDGSRFPGEASLQLVPAGGAERLVAIVRDVSERVEARARLQRLAESERGLSAELRAVIQAIGDAVLAFAPGGRLALSNPAATSLLGVLPADLGELLARLEDEHDVPLTRARLAEAPGTELRLRGAAARRGATVGGADGAPIIPGRWVEASVSTFAPAGEPMEGVDAPEVLVLLRDVTEARERRQTREAFFGVVSHELRTPVTTIYGNSKLLARAARRSAQVRTEALLDIESEAERLYRLVEDLLVLGRFEEGPRPSVGREPVLVQRLAEALVASESARHSGRRFVADLPAGLPPVSGEATYVEQVLRNLIGNAAKYSSGGTITVAATAGSAAHDGAPAQGEDAPREPAGPGTVDASIVGPGEVMVQVLDEGPGLGGADPDRLFELFYRAPDTARSVSGAGIGLFVCRRLVEAMGGRIWARSRPDHRGAEFGFTLRAFAEEEP